MPEKAIPFSVPKSFPMRKNRDKPRTRCFRARNPGTPAEQTGHFSTNSKEYFDKLSQPIKQFAFANNLWYNVDVGEMGQLLTVLSDSADMWLDMRNYCDRAYQAQKKS